LRPSTYSLISCINLTKRFFASTSRRGMRIECPTLRCGYRAAGKTVTGAGERAKTVLRRLKSLSRPERLRHPRRDRIVGLLRRRRVATTAANSKPRTVRISPYPPPILRSILRS
jgi:hypothetical protein